MSVMANDQQRFSGDVKQYDQAVRQLRTTYQTLLDDMNKLQGMWTGEAHEDLQQRFVADYEMLGSVVEYLEAIGHSLDNAEQEYGNCERSVAGIINDLAF